MGVDLRQAMDPTGMNTLLSTIGLSVGYDRRVVLRGVDTAVHPGELVAVIGVNGGGKTTLLNTLSGARPALEGRVLLGGSDLSRIPPRERAKHLSIVLTGRPSTGLLDVRTLVSIGRQPWTGHFGRLGKDDERIMDAAMASMDVLDLSARSFQDLSDGEAQRVMIARALAQDTQILLLDEPMAFLDLVNRVRLVRSLKTLCRTKGRGVVFSTHDLQIALDHADAIWLVNGDLLWTGSPAEVGAGRVLDAVFASEGLRFDPASGSFRDH